MRKNDLFSLSGEAYDISPPYLKTRADQDGARVFEIEGRIGKLRVLDFSEADAERTYKEEADELSPACEFCGGSLMRVPGVPMELCTCEDY